MASKVLNLLAVTSLAILATNFGPEPVSAVAVDGHSHVAARGHDAVAKRRRNSKRACKPRNKQAAAPKKDEPKPEVNTKNNDSGKSDNKGNNNKDNNNSGGASSGSGKVDVPSSTGGKFGLAWSGGDSDALNNFKPKGGKNIPMYTWNPRGPKKAKEFGFNFMPMFWGPDDEGEIQQVIKEGGFDTILAFNEPELMHNGALSSGMDPYYAADLYKKVLSPLKGKYRLATPAVTSGPAGFEWMEKFMGACKDCHFDFQALHWYDISADDAIAHFSKHHEKWNLPIGVTEIAFQNFNDRNRQLNLGQVQSEAGKLNDWFKKTDFIDFVMYFGYQDDMVNVSPTLKLKAGDSPNDLGYQIMGQLA